MKWVNKFTSWKRQANQNYNSGISRPQYEWASSMSLQVNISGEGLRKGKPSKVLLRWNWKQPLNRTVCRCLKGKQSSSWTSSQCLKEYPGKIRIQKEICTPTVALPVTTAKIWKQSVRLHMWMHKEERLHVHQNLIRPQNRMKYYQLRQIHTDLVLTMPEGQQPRRKRLTALIHGV